MRQPGFTDTVQAAVQDGGMKNVEGQAPRALVVDDEADIRELVALTLSRMGLECSCAGSVAEATALLAEGPHTLCLTDMRLPDGDGLAVIAQAARTHPQMPVAVITAYGSAENAVAALKAGAFDYVTKPLQVAQLRSVVRAALRLSQAAADPVASGPVGATVLAGDSEPIRVARAMIERLARSQAPVHICGESGSGKELAARMIHERSVRADRPFVPVNCGAMPENLVESELFGHRRGAFTGADADHEGFFQAADGGTLFLDEVADLPLVMQVKLLRAIQERRVRPVGATQETAVDVRLISATHRDLAAEVREGRFRQDLFYRLNVIELRMPALREMPEDIGPLAGDILARRCASGTAPRLSAAALRALRDYPFPGNVRELENVLERALALCSGEVIEREDLRLEPVAAAAADPRALPLEDYLASVERQAIVEALDRARYNRTAAARLLGITFRQLRYRMQRLGIE